MRFCVNAPKFSVICILTFAGLVAAVSPAKAGQCLRDDAEVRVDGANVVRLNEYVCRSNSGKFEGLKVEFHRLNSLTASMVFAGRLAPQMEAIFGKAKIRQNTVYQHYMDLVAKFGVEFDRGGGAIDMHISTKREDDDGPISINSEDETRDNSQLAETFNGVRFLDTSEVLSVPLPGASETFTTTEEWPEGFHLNYPAAEEPEFVAEEAILVTSLWRYLRPETLANLPDNWRNVNAAVGGANGPSEQTLAQVAFLSYLTREEFPEDFMVVDGATPSECEGGEVVLTFSSALRAVYVQVAVFRNTSNKSIQLDNMLGAIAGKPLLRSVESLAEQKTAAAQVIGGAMTLPPGRGVIVPLYLTLVDISKGPTRAPFPEELRNQKRYHKALRASGQKVFSTEIQLYSFENNAEPEKIAKVKVKKSRKSFKKPKIAKVDDYVYGAAAHLAGFTVGGEKVLFQDTATNFVEFSTGNLEGSCPFLYAWNEDAKRWSNYGKVIHGYYGPKKEANERVKLRRFATRFRLTEHELEVSQINQVRLLVDLRDGRRLFLSPDRKTVQDKDGSYQRIFAGASFEFNFALPDGVDREDVVSSHLDVTGYYLLYGSAFSSAKN
ncbi:MAG: hypothetical protein K0U74_04035 [Alphaproteobacteria bacterium]|nr:hypothetical protein [Alphaproteobacteria bacterium]